ncbi:MAG: hypothetical protein NVSMB16_15740 [Acidimicrobiales bacterium]
MTTFVVTYSHPDEAGWHEHLGPHVDWLAAEVEAGRLRASGPFVGSDVRSAMLIIDAEDRSALDAMIATDPFHIAGLIEGMTITEWDPIFGALAPARPEDS